MHAEIKKQTLALSDILDEFEINRLGKLMFKTVVNSFFLERRTTRGVRVVFFSEQECDPVTMLVSVNLTLQLRKSCSVTSVHMTVIEIVVHRNVDN